MTLNEAITEYVTLIKEIDNFQGTRMETGVKLSYFENERVRLHGIIAEKLECDYDRLKDIFSNLDILVGYPNNTIRHMTETLERLLTCQEGKQFLEGRLYKLNSIYGTITETRPMSRDEK